MGQNPNFKEIYIRFKTAWALVPYKAGVIAVAFSKERFRQQNWVDTYTTPWRRRGAMAKRNRGRALLIDTGRLRRSIRITSTTPTYVSIGSSDPKARVHNEGFSGTVAVKQHVRKRFEKVSIGTGKLNKSGSERMNTVKSVTGEIEVKTHTKRMRMPKRQFMGNSRYLTMQINRMITAEIKRTFRQ